MGNQDSVKPMTTNTITDYASYSKAARATAIYPQDRWFDYLTHGLAGETGELAAALESGVALDFVSEAGDDLWYINELAEHLGTSLEELILAATLRHYEYSDERGAMYKLFASAGRLNEMAKKLMRKPGATLDTALAIECLTDALECLRTVVDCERVSMLKIMQTNINKLSARKQGGTLDAVETRDHE